MVDDLLSRRPAPGRWYGRLKIRHPDRRRAQAPIKNTITVDGPNWMTVYETSGTEGRPPEALAIIYRPESAPQYFYSKGAPTAEGAPGFERMSPDELMRPFGGSDFSLFDLGLQFLRWPEQRLIDRKYKKTLLCDVIESVNPQPDSGEYSRVVSWIDHENKNLIAADAYDTRGRLLKVFSVGEVEKVDGEWRVKELEIRNDQNYSKTELEFQFNVSN